MPSSPPSAAVAGPPLHGRGPQLATLRHAVDDALAGRGTIVLVEGAPGLGKTRLLDELTALADAEGVAVRRGGALPERLSSPLEPLLAALLDGPDPLLRRDGLPLTEDRYWLLHELQERLERRAASTPIVVALDDLQWADAATVGALRTLGPALAGSAIAWVVAFRPGEATAALRRAVRDLRASGALTAVLDPLDEDATRAVLVDLAGTDPRLHTLAAAAGGNPFLLGELVAGLREEGLLDRHGCLAEGVAVRPPARIGAAAAARIEPLPPYTRQVAIAAAVLGRELRLEDLAALLGARPAALLVPVDQLRRADVLLDHPGGLRFRHDLVRDAVLSLIGADTRHALDRQAADVLLAAGASPIEIASRMAAVARPGDEQAIDVLRKAARLLGASDPVTACELSLKALELIPAAAPERAELLQETALLLHLAGRGAEAHAIASDAMVSGLSPVERGRAALAVATMFNLNASVRVEAGDRALALAGLPDELRAAHAAVHVLNLIADGRPADAHRAAERFAPLITASGDAAAQSMLALSGLGLAYVDEDYEGVLARVRMIAEAYAGSAQERLVRHGFEYFRMLALHTLGRTDECLDLAGSWLMTLREARQGQLVPRTELDRGRALFDAGRLADAQAVLEGQLIDGAIPSPLPIPPDAAGILALTRIATHTGNAELGRRCLEIVRETLAGDRSESRRPLAWTLALHALAHGDADGVRAALALLTDRAAESVLPVLARDPCDQVALVRAARLTGDRALADRAVTDARRAAERNPGVALFAAVAAHAEGLRDGDAGALRRAVDGLACRPLALASALEDLGVRLAAEGARAEAVEALVRALGAWARSGASWDARRVRRRLRDLGVRRRVPAEDRPAHGWEALTDSQRHVVELVAQGLTNRATAERLFISPHTVNTHLRHAFEKLGVSSRVELARLVAERGPG